MSIYDTRKAAAYLGTTEATLRKSRHTGFLWGYPTPRYLKTGRICRYRLADLDEFLDTIPLANSCAGARVLNIGLIRE